MQKKRHEKDIKFFKAKQRYPLSLVENANGISESSEGKWLQVMV